MTHDLIIKLDLLPDGNPPSEFRIFAIGENATSKGTFSLSHEDGLAVMEAFAEHGMDRLPIDIDHGMLGPAHPQSSKAAGWFVPELRGDGLFATSVQWTPAAVQALKDREFRFLSPAFTVDEDNAITSLINVALTNLPATKDALPLVAKQDTAADQATENRTMSDTLIKLLGAKDEGEALVIAAELGKTVTEFLSATGASTIKDALVAAKANAALPAEVVKLTADLEAMRAVDVIRDRDDLIAKLSEAGKLPPALHEWAKTQDVASLAAFGEAAPTAAVAGDPPGQPAEGTITLSAEDEASIVACGVDREEFIAERKRELAKKGS